MSNKLPQKKSDKDIRTNNEYSNINLALAGVITSPKDTIKAITHVINGGIQGRALKNFKEAWNLLVENGSINPTYIENLWAEKQFNEILKELSKNDLDEQRIDALISVFLNSAKLNAEELEALRAVEVMKLISQLTAMDIYILRVINDLRHEAISSKDGRPLYDTNAASWERIVLERSKLEVQEIISEVEDKIMEKRLLTGRDFNDRSGAQAKCNACD